MSKSLLSGLESQSSDQIYSAIMKTLKLILILYVFIAIEVAASGPTSSGDVLKAEVPVIPLPKNWKQLSYQNWIKQLAIIECPARYDGDEERFKSFVDLSDNDSLLLITCDLGAYQDAYYIFKLDQLSQSITAFLFNLPSDNDVFKLEVKKLVWGTIYQSDSGKGLEILHLSSGSGMCGYRAYFPLEDLMVGEAINPSKVFADEDCYNGISVEQWPEVSLHL